MNFWFTSTTTTLCTYIRYEKYFQQKRYVTLETQDLFKCDLKSKDTFCWMTIRIYAFRILLIYNKNLIKHNKFIQAFKYKPKWIKRDQTLCFLCSRKTDSSSHSYTAGSAWLPSCYPKHWKNDTASLFQSFITQLQSNMGSR